MGPPTPFANPEFRSASAFNPSGRILPFQSSLAHGSMDGRPRPLEPDLNSAGITLPAHSPACIDPLVDIQTAAINRSSHSTQNFVRPPARTSLEVWYDSQEKPWDPIQGRNPPPSRAGELRGNRLNYRPFGPAFSAYRESNVPSECESTGTGILPSDSGYESRTRHSVINGSIYGDCDRSGETGSISSNLADFQFERPILPSEPWTQHGSDYTTAVSANCNSKLVCPYCNQSVKTRSELKKHKQRHEKPHHCDVPNCTRTEGFSTPNDVDRHKRSCHPDRIPDGKYYRCTIQGCRNKDKKWPRADNFRSHLKRLHKLQPGEEALEAYVYKDPPLSGPEFASLGTSVGVGLIPTDINQNGGVLNPSSWPFLDPRTALQAIQEQTCRDSGTTNYIGHHMEFQQNTIIAQQRLQTLSSNGAAEHIPGAASQLSPAGLGAGNVPAHLAESHARSQSQQALPEIAGAGSDEDFIEADYLNDDSASEQDASEDEGHDETQHAEAELSIVGETRQGVGSPVLIAQDDCEMIYSEPEDANAPANATELKYSISPNPTSSDATTPFSAGDEPTSDDCVVAAQPEHAAVSKSSLEDLDIVNDKSKVSDLIKALEDKGALAEFLEELGYQKSREADAKTNTASSVRSVASDTSQVSCKEPNCGKTFLRPCELKKHQKRHEKPYGCTFPKCFKRFGSKNDWKRHENSQHYQLEMWRCSEQSKTDPKERCGRTCHRREQFKFHLSKDHGIGDSAVVDLKLDSCRIGRNCESRFWCGFCKEIVEIQEGGLKAWTERFNHIDDHFSGRNSAKMNISEWKNCDPDPQDIDRDSARLNDESRSGTPGPSPGPLSEGENALKRGAIAVARDSRPRKRSRITETMWYCCHCSNASLTSTSTICCMDECGHVKCNICNIGKVPRERGGLGQDR